MQSSISIFGKAFGITDFVPSNGWITHWKRRFNISFKKISGEGASCTPEMVSPWKETSLPTLLSNYDLKDIYNTDEFGLFHQMHPEKSLHLKKEQCIGGKQSKVKITGMAVSNALGDKISIFLVSKLVKPCCFKGIKKKPCRNRAQKKSRMTSDLFEEWVHELDHKFQSEDRKIALIVDNCPAHPGINDLKALELVFLPPNTTSHTQPMDQGVIWSLKSKYRILSVRRIITALDEDMPSFSVLNAMKMLVLAWESVTEETIINCVSKAGISKDQQAAAINDDDDPFKALTEELESLRARKLDLAMPEFTSNNLLNIDDGLVCTESLLTDDDDFNNLQEMMMMTNVVVTMIKMTKCR